MDGFIVFVIVALAVGFTIKSFIKTYKGDGGCNCSGCSCLSKKECKTNLL